MCKLKYVYVNWNVDRRFSFTSRFLCLIRKRSIMYYRLIERSRGNPGISARKRTQMNNRD